MESEEIRLCYVSSCPEHHDIVIRHEPKQPHEHVLLHDQHKLQKHLFWICDVKQGTVANVELEGRNHVFQKRREPCYFRDKGVTLLWEVLRIERGRILREGCEDVVRGEVEKEVEHSYEFFPVFNDHRSQDKQGDEIYETEQFVGELEGSEEEGKDVPDDGFLVNSVAEEVE